MSFRDKIKPAYDQEVVDVPEWGVSVTVCSLSLAEKTRVSALVNNHDDLVANLLIATCFDPDTGERAFTEGDLDWLKAQSAGVAERLAAVATRVSGLTDTAVSDPKDASS